jgi:hypothetical protein
MAIHFNNIRAGSYFYDDLPPILEPRANIEAEDSEENEEIPLHSPSPAPTQTENPFFKEIRSLAEIEMKKAYLEEKKRALSYLNVSLTEALQLCYEEELEKSLMLIRQLSQNWPRQLFLSYHPKRWTPSPEIQALYRNYIEIKFASFVVTELMRHNGHDLSKKLLDLVWLRVTEIRNNIEAHNDCLFTERLLRQFNSTCTRFKLIDTIIRETR